MLQIFNSVARHVNGIGCQRKGAFAFYLEPWHPEIFGFIDLRKNFGDIEKRARDIFTALWVPDLFMERVRDDQEWSLIDPDLGRGLVDAWGEDFDRLYTCYEKDERAVTQRLPARRIWAAIVESQIASGVPYILFKDACNMRSNHKHRGVIRGGNLCSEVVQYASKEEVAVCNLASIALPPFVKPTATSPETAMHWDKLRDIARHAVLTVNRCIDRGTTPVAEARASNAANRAIGVGVQGFSDALAILQFPFESPETARLNQLIFENIYFGALDASCQLADFDGPYPTFRASPMSQGLLQFDLCKQDQQRRERRQAGQPSAPPCGCVCHKAEDVPGRYVSCCDCYFDVSQLPGGLPWLNLRRRISRYGVRNSLLTAPMPTASTAQILGNSQSFEPFTSNLYRRSVLAGEFVVLNQYLVKALITTGLWDNDVKEALIASGGSVQYIDRVPPDVKRLFKTAWEIPQRVVIDYARDRGLFVDQSQSLTLYLEKPSFSKVTSMLFYGWNQGLKTGLYYLRCRPAQEPVPVTVTVAAQQEAARARQRPQVPQEAPAEDAEGACATCEA